jgi:hypothetical protein
MILRINEGEIQNSNRFEILSDEAGSSLYDMTQQLVIADVANGMEAELYELADRYELSILNA